MKEGKSLAEKNPCNSPPRSLGLRPSGNVRYGVAAAGSSYLAGIRHLLPIPFSLSALLPAPKRSSWPPRRPAATASRGATSAGGATPVITSQLDWTMNCQRFLFMI